MSRYPTLGKIFEHCLQLPAFVDALPENHPHAAA